MKKLLLIIALAFPFSLNAQVPNGGMESWTSDTVQYEPSEWTTFNIWSALYGIEGFGVAQDPDNVSGNNSIKLTCRQTTAGDTVMAFAVCNGYADSSGFHGGFPLTSMPDSITGWYKFNMQAGDTTFMIVAVSDTGTWVSMMVLPIYGTQNNWTNFQVDIPDYAGSPDSCLIVLAASNFDLQHPGSWTMFDSLQFIGATDTIPNWDFEDWQLSLADELDLWNSSNQFQAGDTVLGVTRSTDAHSGTYSASMETVISSFMGGPVGYIVLGSFGNEEGVYGVPWNDWVDEFSFWYKYAPVSTDTAIYFVGLTRWDTLNGVRDTLFYQESKVGPTGTWTQVNVPINLNGTPDSMFVAFGSSNFNDSTSAISLGSQLWVDDVSVNIVAATNEPSGGNGLAIFPNPADDKLTIRSESGFTGMILIYDAQGRIVKGMNATGMEWELITREFPSGSYYIQFRSDEFSTVKKVNVVH